MMGVRQEIEDISLLVIHCAATPNGKPFNADDIDQWHAERGFHRSMAIAPHHAPDRTHIGYHYVITVDGIPELGRPATETGAHARGYNTGSLSVCLIGTDKFTDRQWATLRELVRQFQDDFPIDAIVGHRDLEGVDKTCPGFSVANWIDDDLRPSEGHIL